MRSLSEQAQTFSRSLDRRIPVSVSFAKFMYSSPLISSIVYDTSGAVSITKRSRALTGPVMTLLDLVVHVPVNCGSVCAITRKVRSSAPAASDDPGDANMKYGYY